MPNLRLQPRPRPGRLQPPAACFQPPEPSPQPVRPAPACGRLLCLPAAEETMGVKRSNMNVKSMQRVSGTVVVVVLMAACGATSGVQRPGAARCSARAGRRHPEDRVRENHPVERPRGDPVRRPSAAARGRQPLVSRRTRQRRARTHRLRASLRAHDVPGVEARPGRHALQDRSKARARAA